MQITGSGRQFLRLAGVNIASNLMVPLAGLVDTAFLGHLSDIRHLAGVALATVLFNYLYWTFGFLRMSTTGLTAQAVGQNDPAKVLLVALRNGGIAGLLGVVILVLHQPLRDWGLGLLSAAPEVKAAAADYFNAMIWGAPATLLNYVLLGWFLGQAQGAVVLVLSLVSNVANVGLNYLLVVHYGGASAGAGAATALSQMLMLLVGLACFLKSGQWSLVRQVSDQLLEGAALRSLFGLNRDLLVRTFALLTAFSVFTNLSSAFSKELLTVNTLLLQVISLAAYFIDGLAYATESCAGMWHGQGEQLGLERLLRMSCGWSLGLGLLFAGVYNLVPRPLFQLLTHQSAILSAIPRYVGWLFPVLGFGSIAYALDGYFLGLGAGRALRNASLLATLLGFLPVALLGWYYHRPQGLWLAMTLFMALRSTALALQVPHTLKPDRAQLLLSGSGRNT
jgi:MATE family multidrug resistance protein